MMAEENEEVKSPYVKKMVERIIPHPLADESVDLDKLQDETTVKTISSILKVFAENANLLVPSRERNIDLIKEDYDAVTLKVVSVLIENNLADRDQQFVIDSLYNIIAQVFGRVTKTKNRYQAELLARVIQTRNPNTGRYDDQYITLGDLCEALDKVRKTQKTEDYSPVTEMVPEE